MESKGEPDYQNFFRDLRVETIENRKFPKFTFAKITQNNFVEKLESKN